MSSEGLDELRTLTVDELSRATGIQQWRLYAMLKDGTAPPFIRIGTTYRFPVAGVKRWIADRTNSPAAHS